jgi:hypothetical protein
MDEAACIEAKSGNRTWRLNCFALSFEYSMVGTCLQGLTMGFEEGRDLEVSETLVNQLKCYFRAYFGWTTGRSNAWQMS